MRGLLERRHAALQLAVVAVLPCLLTAACQRTSLTADGTVTPDVTARPAVEVASTLQSDDQVDLALYFRQGSGEGAHLVRVARTVEISDELPRRAMELLLAGPAPEDGENLTAPLPPSTRLLALRVVDGTAHVSLSREVITDAADVGNQPANEFLALAALTDTLTEFPGIDAVRLSVEGRQAGQLDGLDVAAFWGGWGLPEQMVRDEQVIGQATGPLALPDLDGFSRTPQKLAGDDTATVGIRSVRVRDHTAFVRLVVEVGDGADLAATTAAPPASARALEDGQIMLSVRQVTAYDADVAIGQGLDVGDPTIDTVTVQREPRGSTVGFSVAAHGEPEFWLHSLTSPTRVVLDIRK